MGFEWLEVGFSETSLQPAAVCQLKSQRSCNTFGVMRCLFGAGRAAGPAAEYLALRVRRACGLASARARGSAPTRKGGDSSEAVGQGLSSTTASPGRRKGPLSISQDAFVFHSCAALFHCSICVLFPLRAFVALLIRELWRCATARAP